MVATLAAAGYNGYYDVELIGEEIEALEYQDLLRNALEAYATLNLG